MTILEPIGYLERDKDRALYCDDHVRIAAEFSRGEFPRELFSPSTLHGVGYCYDCGQFSRPSREPIKWPFHVYLELVHGAQYFNRGDIPLGYCKQSYWHDYGTGNFAYRFDFDKFVIDIATGRSNRWDPRIAQLKQEHAEEFHKLSDNPIFGAGGEKIVFDSRANVPANSALGIAPWKVKFDPKTKKYMGFDFQESNTYACEFWIFD